MQQPVRSPITPAWLHRCDAPECRRNVPILEPLCHQHSHGLPPAIMERLREELNFKLKGAGNSYEYWLGKALRVGGE